MGYGIAVAIRIGQFVGSNNSVGPKSTAFVGIFTLGRFFCVSIYRYRFMLVKKI